MTLTVVYGVKLQMMMCTISKKRQMYQKSCNVHRLKKLHNRRQWTKNERNETFLKMRPKPKIVGIPYIQYDDMVKQKTIRVMFSHGHRIYFYQNGIIPKNVGLYCIVHLFSSMAQYLNFYLRNHLLEQCLCRMWWYLFESWSWTWSIRM